MIKKINNEIAEINLQAKIEAEKFTEEREIADERVSNMKESIASQESVKKSYTTLSK